MRFPGFGGASSFLFLLWGCVFLIIVAVKAAIPKCERVSDNDAGDYIEKVLALGYCLDSDPVPNAIFELSPENVFLQSAGSVDGFATINLGGGLHVIGDGSNMVYFYIYKCPGKSRRRGGDRRRHRQMRQGPGGRRSNKKQIKIGPRRINLRCPNEGRRGAVMVDAPPSFGSGFGRYVRGFLNNLNADLKVMIVTHQHNDHNGNLNAIQKANPSLEFFVGTKAVAKAVEHLQNPSYSNPRVQQIFSANPTFPTYPKFDVEIDSVKKLRVGNQTLEVRPGGGHVEGNMFVYHEASKSIMNVDLAGHAKWAPFFGLGASTDVPAIFELFDMFREYDYDYFLSGHLTHIGTKADVDLAEEFLVDILDAAFRFASQTAENFESKANFGNILFNTVNVLSGTNAGNQWLVFNEFSNQAAVGCAEIVLDHTRNYSGKKWQELLAGVRTSIFSHCSVMGTTLLLDTPGTVVA